jgi:cytochrome c553
VAAAFFNNPDTRSRAKEIAMKPAAKLLTLSLLAATALPAWSAGDPVAGQVKAAACMLCHGSKDFPGMFYTLQLAGRNADKLTVKTNKYRSGKLLHPMMNVFTVSLRDQDVEDISAYYQGLGKPALVSPFFVIQGDDPEPAR